MAKAPAPHPRTALPTWPKKLSQAGKNPRVENEELVQALAPLGFDLLFDDRYESLSQQLHARHQEVKRRSLAKRGIGVPVRNTITNWTQVWRHPAGIVVLVDRFQNHPNGAWMFNNNIQMVAYEEVGYGASVLDVDPSARPTVGPSFGHISHRGQEGFAALWERLRGAAREGRLTPLSQWDQFPTGRILLTAQPRHYALPRIAPTTTLPELSQMERNLLATHAPKLGKARLAQIDQLKIPEEEKAAWKRLVGGEVAKVVLHSIDTSVSPPTWPRWMDKLLRDPLSAHLLAETSKPLARAQMRRQSAQWILHAVLEDFGMEPGDPLFPDERATLSHWLDTLSDLRHPSRIADQLGKAHATPLARFGLHYHHLLFAVSFLPGVPRQLAHWQAGQSRQTLADMCVNPAGDGKTLPMRWAETWMQVPNARAVPRRFRHRQSAAHRALDALEALVTCSQWVLRTPTRSLWDAALAGDINARVDEDLVPHYRHALSGLLARLASHGSELPLDVFVPGTPDPVPLTDAHALEEAFAKSPRFAMRDDASERTHLLGPLVALVQGAALQGQLPVSSEASYPRHRPRL